MAGLTECSSRLESLISNLARYLGDEMKEKKGDMMVECRLLRGSVPDELE